MNTYTPNFYIGEIPIYGNTVLAPMDGYTDSPYRIIAKKFGSALLITEFINAIDVLGNRKYFDLKTRFTDFERPIGFQIFDDDPERILQAAYVLLDKKPDFFDINFGCSARKVADRGAGAALLKEPKKIAKIVSTLSRNFSIPITAKIRLGWDEDTLNYLEVAKIIEENGGKMLSVHGRTKSQSFKGNSNWKAISEIKNALRIPVIGNGDIIKIDQIDSIMNQTGVDGIMIGRASIGNPWIFSRLDPNKLEKTEIVRVLIEHLNLTTSFYDARLGLIRFRKILKKYLSYFRLNSEMMAKLLKLENPKELISIINNL